jgi:hypothetical protein
MYVHPFHNNFHRRLLTGAMLARMSIDTLPDVALLEIFDFYLGDQDDRNPSYDLHWKVLFTAWHPLVHVCRKWRNVVFGSPLRLDLRVNYEPHRTSLRETMVVWPSLRIAVSEDCDLLLDDKEMDNFVAVFEHSDRICRLSLGQIRSWQLEKVLAAMQRPFPALKRLYLCSRLGETAPVVPDSFLGGSAPQLQKFVLRSIPFPGLQKILLSATQLVHLEARGIPHSGYISPETMVACLSVLARLEILIVRFESPQSCPDRNSLCLPPPTRAVLPVLHRLEFEGASEYLEYLVARIDVPVLRFLSITFFHQLIFDTPQLTQLIGRHTPQNKTLEGAYLKFLDWDKNSSIMLISENYLLDYELRLNISCRHSRQPYWQLSFLTQMCSSTGPHGLIPAVENLYIDLCASGPAPWESDINASGGPWLELLHSFTGVKALYISDKLTPRIAYALQELVGERAMEVLPALQEIYLKYLSQFQVGPVRDAIDQFVAARQLTGHPVAVFSWQY